MESVQRSNFLFGRIFFDGPASTSLENVPAPPKKNGSAGFKKSGAPGTCRRPATCVFRPWSRCDRQYRKARVSCSAKHTPYVAHEPTQLPAEAAGVLLDVSVLDEGHVASVLLAKEFRTLGVAAHDCHDDRLGAAVAGKQPPLVKAALAAFFMIAFGPAMVRHDVGNVRVGGGRCSIRGVIVADHLQCDGKRDDRNDERGFQNWRVHGWLAQFPRSSTVAA